MTTSGLSPTNIWVYLETADHSNRSKQISHVEKITLIQGDVLNQKKIAIQNICSVYEVCLVLSWQACINDKKVKKTFPDGKVINTKESSTNIDAQCHLYPREKRVQLSSWIRYMADESSVTILLNTEDIKNISLTPCTKCSCSKMH